MKNKEKMMKKDEMKKLWKTGSYIVIWKSGDFWMEDGACGYFGNEDADYKLIHVKHKEILDAVLADSSVEVEKLDMYGKWTAIPTGDFIDYYDEGWSYQLATRQGEKVMAKELKEITDEYYKGFGKDNSEYKDGYLAGDMFKNEVLSIKYDNLSKKYMDLVDKYSNLVDKYLEIKAN